MAFDLLKSFDTLPHATVKMVKSFEHESSERHSAVGVPRGADQSPTIFNIAMIPLLWKLAQIRNRAFTVHTEDVII